MMPLLSMFPLLIIFVEFTTFIFVWFFLLTGFFYIVKHVSTKCLGRFSIFLSSALTISICFHLIKMYNELKAIKTAAIATGPPLSCQSYILGLLTLSPSCSSYFIAFNDNILWKLNPFYVLCDFISELFVIFAETIGKVTGRFVASLLNELPWIYQFPALILLLVSIFSSLLILKNYNFHFFYGILDISNDKNVQKVLSDKEAEKAVAALPPTIPPHRSPPVPYRRIRSF
jgi:hypothetical protein